MSTYLQALISIPLEIEDVCKDLHNPDYGKVKQAGNYVGAKAIYTCDYGYKLVGKSERMCMYDGYWSDDEPKCIKSK